tara:strand:- start:74996 stop:75640 length:645 start_codon:yes stop_codon:yes gene_type:complete
MINQIQHFLRNNFTEIIANSFMNCYAMGVHSIVLFKSDDFTMKLTIAEESSELHNPDYEWPIHTHKCDATLHILKGVLVNKIYKKVPSKSRGADIMDSYINIINHNDLDCEKPHYILGQEEVNLIRKSALEYYPDYSVNINSNVLHTLKCRRGLVAWVTYESKPNFDHDPTCFSKIDPNINLKNTDLYKKPTKVDVMDLLRQVFPKLKHFDFEN